MCETIRNLLDQKVSRINPFLALKNIATEQIADKVNVIFQNDHQITVQDIVSTIISIKDTFQHQKVC